MAVPVTIAAWMLRIPVVLHESDLSLGLANRLSLPFLGPFVLHFPNRRSEQNAIVTGTPIRAEIGLGSRRAGLEFCRFSHQLPTLLVMGGSLGSAVLNEIVRVNLDELTASYQIIHLCGRGEFGGRIEESPRYFQLEYARDELPDLFAAADFAISRAGANAIFELLALAKPHILVPLSLQASRGDQILNAASFARQGFSLVLQEEDLTLAALREQLDGLRRQREKFVSTMRQSGGLGDGTQNVLRIIEQVAAGR